MDTGLLLWLQLTGVSSNHKLWRTAVRICECVYVCVSVVMLDGVALSKRKMCLFLTKVTFLSRQDLGQSAISFVDRGSKYVL